MKFENAEVECRSQYRLMVNDIDKIFKSDEIIELLNIYLKIEDEETEIKPLQRSYTFPKTKTNISTLKKTLFEMEDETLDTYIAHLKLNWYLASFKISRIELVVSFLDAEDEFKAYRCYIRKKASPI